MQFQLSGVGFYDLGGKPQTKAIVDIGATRGIRWHGVPRKIEVVSIHSGGNRVFETTG